MSAILDAIERTKRGEALPEALIGEVVAGFHHGAIPDYQMAAWLMAVRLQGLTYEETVAMTTAMADSGVRHAFPDCVDKHSTGGVGDKVSLCALPLAVACGAPVAKLSGRGLGQTGGTIDKLESIPGLTCALDGERFRRQVERVGLAIVEATDLAPADKPIYALRDATGTVDSLPLIGASIVSKKAATGAGHLLYDVKCGAGAFMRTPAEARELARLLVGLSQALGTRAHALITGMDQPLGSAVGNALEIRETVAFLRGEPVADDLAALSLHVARRLVELHGGDPAEVDGRHAAGAGFEVFARFVAAQGGDPASLDALDVAADPWTVTAPHAGTLARVDALAVGRAALALGAGRQTKADAVRHDVGLELLVKVGDAVEAGQPLATVYGRRDADTARALLEGAFTLAEEPVERPPLILEEVA
jgi:pyrimidine-nucleoside phosphorylase